MGVVTGCEHLGISVADVERSAQFYEEHLGFKRVDRVARSESYVQRVVGYYPDVTLQIATLEIPGADVTLEIIEYEGVDKTPIDGANANPGTAHLSLYVDDLGEIYARLKSKGVEFVSEVENSTAGPLKGGRVVYMIDPDGIRVELVELPKAAADA